MILASFKQIEQDEAGSDPSVKAGWRGFYGRYPGSGGYVVLSVVGFNKNKTRVMVFSGASCGPLGGAASFHLFKKVHGKWTQTAGIMCYFEL